MNISYVNFYNQLITEQQATNTSDFIKVFRDPQFNNIKMKQRHYDFKPSTLIYYKDSDELNEQIANQFSNIEGMLEIVDTEYIGMYRLEKQNCYYDGILGVKGKTLFIANEENRYIGNETIDKITNLTYYELTIKYYYDDALSERHPVFEVHYKEEDGSLNYLKFNENSRIYGHLDEEHYTQESIDDGSWEQLRVSLEIPLERMNYYKYSSVIPL
jgi:hypothetical protein